MNETLAYVFCTVLFLSFVSAGLLEFQRDRCSLRSLPRGLPLGLALILSALLLMDLWHPYFSFNGGSLPITALALMIPISAVVCRYKSRVAAVLIFVAGLLLAFFWFVNRIVA